MDKTPDRYGFIFDRKQMDAEKEFKGNAGKQYDFATGSSRNKTVCLSLKDVDRYLITQTDNTLREGVVDNGYSTEKLALSDNVEPTKKWLPSEGTLQDPTKSCWEL